MALVTLRPGFEGLIVPSKVLSYMSRGIPILTSTHRAMWIAIFSVAVAASRFATARRRKWLKSSLSCTQIRKPCEASESSQALLQLRVLREHGLARYDALIRSCFDPRSIVAKIALTNSCGFVGSHLGADLNTRGHSVTEIGKDLLHSTELANSLRGTEIYFTRCPRARTEGRGDGPAGLVPIGQCRTTQIVARAAARAAVRRFIFLSSAGVRDDAPRLGDLPINCPWRPTTPTRVQNWKRRNGSSAAQKHLANLAYCAAAHLWAGCARQL